ncbi:MAG: hypothetical protein Q8Q33_08945, partial [Chlamydiota bacterium]|nr:hypothetical protein [Chlamydiota bacterium]
NRNGLSATGSNGLTWDVVNSALVSTVNGNSGYSYMNSDVVNISQVENMAISYDVTFENGAAWGGILYRGYYLDVNPVRTGWRDNSYKTYAGISSGVKHHVLILIHANSPYYTSDLYVDGKEVFKNEPIEVSSWWNQTIGFVSNYYKGKVTYDNIIIWPNPNPMLLPLDENFNNDEYGLWIGEGNKNINWSFKYGALQSKPNVSGSGYGYFKHALVDVSNKDIIVEYDTAFYKNAKWGGFMYRGVYCDINPSRIGWRDSQYQYTSGFFKNNKQYHVTFIIRQADPYPVSTLYVDDVLIFENEPIEKSSFSDNLIGYVSNYYTGEAYFDNLTVKVFEAGFNLAPAILPIEENTVSLGTTMSFKLEAVDNESDILQYYSDDMLAGSSLDAQTGTFVWTPQYEDIGKHSVHFRVSDGENQSEKELQITVVSPSFTLHYSENFDSGSDVIGEWSESGSGDHIDWKVENRKLCATVIPNTTDGYSYLNSGPIQLPDLNSKKVGIEFDIMPIGNASWGGVRVGGIQCDINPLRIGWRDANYTYSASPIVQMNKQHVIMMINGNKSDIFVDGVHIIKNETIDSPFVNNTLEFVSNYYAGCLNFDNVRVYDLSETTGFQQNPEAFYVSYDFAGSNFNGWTITGNTDNVQFSVLDGKLISQVTGSGGYAYIYPYSLDVSGRSISIEYDVQYDLGASWGGLLYRGIYLDMNPLRIGWRDNNYTPIASTVTANALHHVKVVVRDDQTSDIYVDGQAILMNEPLDVSSFTNNSVGFVSNYYNGQVAISNFSITEDVN